MGSVYGNRQHSNQLWSKEHLHIYEFTVSNQPSPTTGSYQPHPQALSSKIFQCCTKKIPPQPYLQALSTSFPMLRTENPSLVSFVCRPSLSSQRFIVAQRKASGRAFPCARLKSWERGPGDEARKTLNSQLLCKQEACLVQITYGVRNNSIFIYTNLGVQ